MALKRIVNRNDTIFKCQPNDELYENNMMKKKPAIFLMGPTAAGKTALALELAQKLPVEIISVDSAMVYTGMNIGTGKPTPEELLSVPHHLVDIRDPIETYSAAQFAKDALALMQQITERGCIPLLVGGTFLYFKALQQGLSPLPAADKDVRAELLENASVIGWAAMHQRLREIDPKSAQRIHPNDPQRIQRALEVYEITGRPMSSFFKDKSIDLPIIKDECLDPRRPVSIEQYDIHAFALAPENRSDLHQSIEQRFRTMLEQGLVAEVERLFKRGDLDIEMPAMRAVGYRQVWGYLEGHYTYNEMTEKAIAATRQLAKRQLTWLRGMSDVMWLLNNHLASLNTVLHCVS